MVPTNKNAAASVLIEFEYALLANLSVCVQVRKSLRTAITADPKMPVIAMFALFSLKQSSTYRGSGAVCRRETVSPRDRPSW